MKIIKLDEMRKDEDLYLVGPFWIISESLEKLNSGDFNLIAKKFLVDYEGRYNNPVSKSEFTHKGIWGKEYSSKYPGKEYDYFPRGRVSWDSVGKKFWINIPKGLNEKIILPKIAKEYGFRLEDAEVRYTDPTSGNHYSFKLL